jgi:hypothetical protein
MAATCGTCKAPNQTIDHIRACSGATPPAAPQRPRLAPGNVVTIDLEDGYWTVESVTATHALAVRDDATRRTVNWPLMQVEMVFANEQAAADWRMAQDQAAERERVAQVLHGRPAQEQGYYASKHEVRGDAATDMVEVPGLPGVRVPAQPSGDVWGPVDALRKQVAAHLYYETSQGGTTKRMGHFAVEVDGTLKFLRVKKILSGRYANRMFVDSMGSSTAYPVKAPATLTTYLTAVLVDPAAAAKRYADEMGECSDCGRPLTNEESRERGVGPDCWAKR